MNFETKIFIFTLITSSIYHIFLFIYILKQIDKQKKCTITKKTLSLPKINKNEI